MGSVFDPLFVIRSFVHPCSSAVPFTATTSSLKRRFHHTSRASNLFRSREFLSRMGRRHLLPLPHSASDNRLTVIEPCLPPRCAEIVRTIVSGWPSAFPTRECETSCLTWRAHGRGWL